MQSCRRRERNVRLSSTRTSAVIRSTFIPNVAGGSMAPSAVKVSAGSVNPIAAIAYSQPGYSPGGRGCDTHLSLVCQKKVRREFRGQPAPQCINTTTLLCRCQIPPPAV
jgi:hypothetical protein